jgi:hypothetical protein
MKEDITGKILDEVISCKIAAGSKNFESNTKDLF